MTAYKDAKYNFDGSNLTGMATAFDDNKIQANIALMGFKIASADALAKYSLQDQVIYPLKDLTGIDASASSNESLNSTNTGIFGGAAGTTYVAPTNPSAATTPSTSSPNLRPNSGSISATLHDDNWNAGNDTADAQSYVNGWFYEDYGSGTTYKFARSSWKHSSTASGAYTVAASNNASDWTTIYTGTGNTAFLNSTSGSGNQTIGGLTYTFSPPGTAYRYWRMLITAHDGNTSSNDMHEIKFYQRTGDTIADLTAVSNTTVAETDPNTCDLIISHLDTYGTATINTDVKGYISQDAGSTWTEATLVDEGDIATNTRLLVAHDVDTSAQSGTNMRWKITTHNQSATSKEGQILGVSLGWKV